MLSLLRNSPAGRRQMMWGILLRLLAQLGAVLPFFIAWLALRDITPGGGDWAHWPLLLAALAGCLLLHEYLIRRVRWIRPLFGLKAANGDISRRHTAVTNARA